VSHTPKDAPDGLWALRDRNERLQTQLDAMTIERDGYETELRLQAAQLTIYKDLWDSFEADRERKLRIS